MLRSALRNLLNTDDPPERTAWAFAIGVFIAFSPLLGLHTIIAAIIAVADTFDAMTTDRSYRKGLSKETAIKEIKNCVNKQFHPKPVFALVELYEKGEI